MEDFKLYNFDHITSIQYTKPKLRKVIQHIPARKTWYGKIIPEHYIVNDFLISGFCSGFVSASSLESLQKDYGNAATIIGLEVWTNHIFKIVFSNGNYTHKEFRSTETDEMNKFQDYMVKNIPSFNTLFKEI